MCDVRRLKSAFCIKALDKESNNILALVLATFQLCLFSLSLSTARLIQMINLRKSNTEMRISYSGTTNYVMALAFKTKGRKVMGMFKLQEDQKDATYLKE